MFRLDGKVVIVTGGAGYYGKPITLALAEAGAKVIIASRNTDKCNAYAKILLQSSNLKVEVRELDLCSEESITTCISNITNQFKRIDILINNAVCREGFNDLEQIAKAEWENAQQINSTGLILITKAVLKVMRNQQSGNIINIGSIYGSVGPNFPVYGNTGMSSPVNYTYDKWAMVGLTKWIANYYGRFNIRSNCISPGGFGPGVAENIGDNEFTTNYKRLTPLGRFAENDDIKGPIVFLASEASAYITGHNLLVDGGWTSW
jgi:NAD(P)-dependent dehydrogenase (short-subunit alcohol dehydrogenase family)